LQVKGTKAGGMSQQRGPFPLLSLAAVLVAFLVISAIDRITHSDVIAAVATLVLLGAYVAWWFWRHRYS
jgi:Flp pilus assembly protein TadB